VDPERIVETSKINTAIIENEIKATDYSMVLRIQIKVLSI
jgi:hypothetical protein